LGLEWLESPFNQHFWSLDVSSYARSKKVWFGNTFENFLWDNQYNCANNDFCIVRVGSRISCISNRNYFVSNISKGIYKRFISMKCSLFIIESIPTILVTWFFGFIPWGIITVLVTIIGTVIFAAFFPKKSYIKINIKTAIEGLSYGHLDDAREFILIAIREAENAPNLEISTLKDICDASDQISSAFEKIGKHEEAQSLQKQCSNIYERCANIKL
jgi:hypothetical protein